MHCTRNLEVFRFRVVGIQFHDRVSSSPLHRTNKALILPLCVKVRATFMRETYHLWPLRRRDSVWEHFAEYEPLSKLRLKYGRDGAVFPYGLFGVLDFQRPDVHEVVCHLKVGSAGGQSLGFVGYGVRVGPETR